MAETLGLHADGTSTGDTLSSTCVPIVFVPGVMGSRFQTGVTMRAWDPDAALGSAMLPWASTFKDGKQKTRRALRAPQTSATILDELAGSAGTPAFGPAKAVTRNRALCAIVCNMTGGDPDSSDCFEDVLSYYGKRRGWAGVAWGFYGDLLMTLEASLNADPTTVNFPVYAFGYDWRQSNVDSGLALSQFVSDLLGTTGATQVLLVTHSMGGLVVRAALAYDGLFSGNVLGVVHTLQPSNGAITCYRSFLSGSAPPLDAVHEVADRVLHNILGTTADLYAYNLSATPGPLQLLPNHLYQNYFVDDDETCGGQWIGGLDSSVNLNNIYDVYRGSTWPGVAGAVQAGQTNFGTDDEQSSGTVVSDFGTNLSSAQGFHQNVGTIAHPNTYALYSTGRVTDHAILFANLGGSIASPDSQGEQWSFDGMDVTNNWQEITYRRRANGDGTVPAVSAECPALSLKSAAVAAANAIEHAKAFGDDAFRQEVLQYIHFILTPSSP